MKKIFLGLIAVMIIFNVGCKKDIQTSEITSNSSTFNFETVQINKEQSKINLDKIKAFKDRMKSGSKDIEWLTEEEAEWLIDAAANFDFATMSQAYSEYEHDTLMYLLPIDSEGISSKDLETLYDEITEDMETIISSLNNGEDVEIQGIVIKFSTVAGIQDMISVELLWTMGFYPNESPFTIANDDYWYWGKGLGKVNNTMIGDDATTAITLRANQAIIAFYHPSSYTFSDNEWVTIHFDDIEAAFSNNFGSRIWHVEVWCTDQYGEPILNPTTMNEFLNYALYLAQQEKPVGKMIKFIDVNWGEFGPYHTDGSPWYYNKWHSVSVEYATPN